MTLRRGVVAEVQPMRGRGVVAPGFDAEASGKEEYMARTILLILVVLVLLAIVLVWSGMVNLQQTEGGGLQVETRDVEVGTTVRNAQVPVLRMEERQVEVPSIGVRDTAGENVQVNAQ